MTDQTPETTQLFLTAAMPCPYLPGKQERKLFTHLSGRRASNLHHLLSENGFRRSQNLIYRPACEGCNACQSVRIVADGFAPSKRYRRALRANDDLSIEVRPTTATSEQYDLFKRYLDSRHAGGGMTQMSYVDYEYMVEDTPVQSILIEYRLREHPNQPLVAVALTDVMPDGLSMVYSFYDPDMAHRSLGTFLILDHIAQVRSAALDYVYLGYWVQNSPKMAYKAQFRPLQVQRGPLGWVELS
ncbi:arginyltransferase [Devosia neptuniae]|jgi:arginyl-tRNA--protein-N-Asp/Glu arginylyltransferase|uniref:arginyltransferase n=1 Tax=Devosia TaxID=46913 RepID=UPI0022AFC960|nr:arginyltransferase [Devosia neptuniae]MCZ4346135.1 arginyltransferase [Devosia neptuniae]|tara:strand:- start:4327 stop:5055 length:729 start_codon:yes stop_codon:yes gene_type:complete